LNPNKGIELPKAYRNANKDGISNKIDDSKKKIEELKQLQLKEQVVLLNLYKLNK
jgi:hypothetical protein